MKKTPQFWQKRTIISTLLRPFSWLYWLGTWIDYRIKKPQAKALPLPVIVVGNITMGGSGKTPTIIALINGFRAQNIRVGLLSRGYGRKSEELIIANAQSSPEEIGDEPYLIYQKTAVPMAINADRYQAGIALLAQEPSLDLILCDDGLQHHRLKRDIEIAVVGRQGLGNRLLFPAGPLREKASRLKRVDFIVNNGASATMLKEMGNCPIIELQSSLGEPYNLNQPIERSLTDFIGKPISAVAGIAYPDNFFTMLKTHSLTPTCYSFPDHYIYNQTTFETITPPILMTEKDAVKCQSLNLNDCWAVPLISSVSDQFITTLIKMIK